MVGYKVVMVRAEDQSLWSATPYGRRLLYRPNQPTVPMPDDGPMGVFVSRGDAEAFVVNELDWHSCFFRETYQVWRCRFRSSKRTTLWMKDGALKLSQRRLPPGTVLADTVTLLEQVN